MFETGNTTFSNIFLNTVGYIHGFAIWSLDYLRPIWMEPHSIYVLKLDLLLNWIELYFDLSFTYKQAVNGDFMNF